jgi:hypothetical protein
MTYLTDSEIEQYKTADEMAAFLDSVKETLVLNYKGFAHMRKLMRGHGFEDVTDQWWLKKGWLGKYKGVKLWASRYKNVEPGSGLVGEPHNDYENGFPRFEPEW